MSDFRKKHSNSNHSSIEINRLPSSKRESAGEKKYSEAVNLYASTDLPLRIIAKISGVTPSALSAHIARHHRPLLYARYGLTPENLETTSLKVKPRKGQSANTYHKYKKAIEASCDLAYIEYNISQIARMFNLNGTALASQLKVHYPEVIPNREIMRQRLGIADNTYRGARPTSKDIYTKALEMYRDTDLTIPEVAERCDVSKGGLTQFLRFYHKDIIEEKAARRSAARKAVGNRKQGELSGNGMLYGPKNETIALYAEALQLYKTSSLTITEIIEKTGVPAEGFKGYLHQWHRGEKMRRRGFEWDGISKPNLDSTRAFLKSTTAKYAPAIASLKKCPRPVATVAAEFNLNPDVFREYLKVHEPAIAESQGMMRLGNGRRVKKSTYDKYNIAVTEYAGSPESLKIIASRHGVTYNSILGFILRNCPDAHESHKKIVEQAKNTK